MWICMIVVMVAKIKVAKHIGAKARQMMHTYHEILDFCCEQDMVLPRLQCYPIQMNKDLLHVVYRPQKNWMKRKTVKVSY